MELVLTTGCVFRRSQRIFEALQDIEVSETGSCCLLHLTCCTHRVADGRFVLSLPPPCTCVPTAVYARPRTRGSPTGGVYFAKGESVSREELLCPSLNDNKLYYCTFSLRLQLPFSQPFVSLILWSSLLSFSLSSRITGHNTSMPVYLPFTSIYIRPVVRKQMKLL